MNAWGVVFLIMVLPARAESVPCSTAVHRPMPCLPSAEERSALVRQVQQAVDDYDAFMQVKDEEERARGLLLLGQYGRSSEDAVQAGAALEQWRHLADVRSELESKARAEFRDVARQTAEYYGVEPAAKQGTIHGGLLDGQVAHWVPVMQEEKDFVYGVPRDKKKDQIFLKYSDKDKRGHEVDSDTLDDGGVFISLRVFREVVKANDGKGDPSILAEKLAMERFRFDRLVCNDVAVCPERGLWTTKEQIERLAVGQAQWAGERMGLNPDAMAALKDRGDELVALQRGRALTGAYADDSDSQSNLVAWADVQGRLRVIRRQEERLNKNLEAARRGEALDLDHDALNDGDSHGGSESCGGAGFWAGNVYFPAMPCPQAIQTPPSPPPAVAVPYIPPPPAVAYPAPPPAFDVWGALKSLSERGCESLEKVSEPEFTALWPRIRGTPNYEDAAQRMGMFGCPGALLQRLLLLASQYRDLTYRDFLETAIAFRSQFSRVPTGPEPVERGDRGGDNSRPHDPCEDHGSFEGGPTGCQH